MAVRKILLFPEPLLSRPCRPVASTDRSLEKLIADLTATLHTSPGVGLAAPQIGVTKQVSVIDVRRRTGKIGTAAANHGEIILINPVLITAKGEQIPREGCLSVPDLLGNVRRHQEVQVRTDVLSGGKRIITAVGFEALALQHEIDHLQGKLFLDRIININTDIFRRSLEKA